MSMEAREISLNNFIELIAILERFMKLVNALKILKYREGSHEKTIELIMLKNKNLLKSSKNSKYSKYFG
jgi:hypothetical protein